MTSLSSLLKNSHTTCPTTYSTFLLGHRGARGERLENSREGFIYTHRLSHHSQDRLVGIEFDVQLTQDGKLVVFHDDTMLRLFSRQSRIDQCTAAEIQRLSGGAIMLLEEMPEVLVGYRHIELEIKTHNRTNYSRLLQALKQCLSQSTFKQLPITLTSFDVQLLDYLQADCLLNTFKRGLLVEPISSQSNPALMSTGQLLSHTIDTALRLQCEAVGLYYLLFNESFVTQCRRYGLSTTAWTVNDTDYAKYLIKLGVNYLITDYPSVFLNNEILKIR
ncbi:glycerophosphodiester phosphodiesterase [Psychrobacter sanguinis]|uniref:glycerophosphodiester phosphodiesterase n=1 Tax=Psychrobacter sanguinis TaxID=861445 RepID=UPI001918D6F7|nr:glycerophosphodiester phosphodiesterase [Psychrobacter sanguinis]MCC3307680.1 glycerophosphodiester phosphodiesterase [Psychrobacter sanguinis]UEC25000.1 glycerophosphodiester phosphodiesterase [Psychrobacter sanguinis]